MHLFDDKKWRKNTVLKAKRLTHNSAKNRLLAQSRLAPSALTKLSLALLAAASSPALAGGFQLNEFSSAGLGRAYAGEAAIADTPDSASRNPATILLFDRAGISLGAIFIDPVINVRGQSASGDNLNTSNVVPATWLPNLHIIYPINSRIGLAASLTSNYGLGTQYNADYAAGEIAGTTSLMTANANISAAYRLSPHWLLGLGLNAVFGQAKVERYTGIHTTSQLNALKSHYPELPSVPAGVSAAHMRGNGRGYGVNGGILYQADENNRYALIWRSKVVVKFYGNYRSDLPNNAIFNHDGVSSLATGGQLVAGRLNLNLPEVWEFSAYNKIAPQWAIHYGVTYTRWSQFQQLKATAVQDGSRLFERYEGFHNAWRAALGASWYADKHWTVRGGIALDQSPIPQQNRSISIPDQNRLWLSAGVSYAFNQQASLDAGISYMHGQKVVVNDDVYKDTDLYTHASAWLYGINFNYLF